MSSNKHWLSLKKRLFLSQHNRINLISLDSNTFIPEFWCPSLILSSDLDLNLGLDSGSEFWAYLSNQTGVLDLNRPESWFSLASMSEKNIILVYLASVARETRILVCLASESRQTRSLVQLACESRQTRSLVQLASSMCIINVPVYQM